MPPRTLSLHCCRDKSASNYVYLTVEQALADLVHFQDYFQKYMGRPLRFFAFGGSYPGALSAWYRVAYPDKTLGALSSSGVVNALLEFPQFDELVRGSARQEGGCGSQSA